MQIGIVTHARTLNSVLGNLEGVSYTGDFGRWMKEGSRNGASLSEGAPWGEPGGRDPLLSTRKDILSKALEMGNTEGRSFPSAFERREIFSLFRGIFMRNFRDM
jgi:hypothetical protein